MTTLKDLAQAQDVFELIQGDWATLKADAETVRRAVFIDEQGIDESEEWDTDDERSDHVIVRRQAGQVVGTGRLIPQDEPVSDVGRVCRLGRIGRMSVIKSCRGLGVGERILNALLDTARQKGFARVEISAQVAAQGFYSRAGFMADGEVYDEVGIPHQAMFKQL
ncbi:MAG: GNAT family N-acetyltransferase [Burkholderiales bacterium]|nr:GNAT family N-acetyltransferase [Burkholderiales bacterium]